MFIFCYLSCLFTGLMTCFPFLLQKRAETSRNLEWFLLGRSGAPFLPHSLHPTCQTIAPYTPCMADFLGWTQTLWFHQWHFIHWLMPTIFDSETVFRRLPLPLQTVCIRLLPPIVITRTSHPTKLQQHRKQRNHLLLKVVDIEIDITCEIPLSFIQH